MVSPEPSFTVSAALIDTSVDTQQNVVEDTNNAMQQEHSNTSALVDLSMDDTASVSASVNTDVKCDSSAAIDLGLSMLDSDIQEACSTDSMLTPSTADVVHVPPPSTSIIAAPASDAQIEPGTSEISNTANENVEDDETLKRYADIIVKDAIQNGLVEFQKEESRTDSEINDNSNLNQCLPEPMDNSVSDFEGKKADENEALVVGSLHGGDLSSTHIMDTSRLKAFLEKFDDPQTAPPVPSVAPPDLSQTNPIVGNVVAGNIAKDMVADSKHESPECGANSTNSLIDSDSSLTVVAAEPCMSPDVLSYTNPACSVVMDTPDLLHSSQHAVNSNDERSRDNNSSDSSSVQEHKEMEPNSESPINETVSRETVSDIQKSLHEIEEKLTNVEKVFKNQNSDNDFDLKGDNVHSKDETYDSNVGIDENSQNIKDKLPLEEEIALPETNLHASDDESDEVCDTTKSPRLTVGISSAPTADSMVSVFYYKVQMHKYDRIDKTDIDYHNMVAYRHFQFIIVNFKEWKKLSVTFSGHLYCMYF